MTFQNSDFCFFGTPYPLCNIVINREDSPPILYYVIYGQPLRTKMMRNKKGGWCWCWCWCWASHLLFQTSTTQEEGSPQLERPVSIGSYLTNVIVSIRSYKNISFLQKRRWVYSLFGTISHLGIWAGSYQEISRVHVFKICAKYQHWSETEKSLFVR